MFPSSPEREGLKALSIRLPPRGKLSPQVTDEGYIIYVTISKKNKKEPRGSFLLCLFSLNVLIDRCGCGLTCAHGEDDRCGTGNGVAAGAYALDRGQTVLIRNDPTSWFQVRG